MTLYPGRQLEIYEAPRTIINAFPGARFNEMPRNRRDAFLLGGAWLLCPL